MELKGHNKSSAGEYKEVACDDGVTSHTYIPGFAYMDKNKKNKEFTVTNTQFLTQPLWKAEDVTTNIPGMLPHSCIWDEQGHRLRYNFIKHIRVEFSREYIQALRRYKLSNACDDVPMAGTARVVHLGNTSYSVHNVLCNADTGVRYASFEALFVPVATKTRRPAPIPDQLRIKYKITNPKRIQIISIPNTPPDGSLVWDEVTIKPHMIDQNKHTNNDHYQDFALGALAKSFSGGKFRGHSYIAEVNELNVKSVSTTFQGESHLGDVVQVGIWQDEYSDDVFYCLIKTGGRLLTTIEIQLFSDRTAARL